MLCDICPITINLTISDNGSGMRFSMCFCKKRKNKYNILFHTCNFILQIIQFLTLFNLTLYLFYRFDNGFDATFEVCKLFENETETNCQN